MAIDAFTATIGVFIVGISGGAFSSFLGWVKDSTATFEVKKFLAGLITGAVAGLIFAVGSVNNFTSVSDPVQLLVAYAVLFVAVIGLDNARTAISGSVATREETKQ